ncbi:hypothetical protein U1Q18_041217 [Sarracenia purpurea var. burkii]
MRGSWVPRSEVCPCPPPCSAAPVARSLPSTVRVEGGEENIGVRSTGLMIVGKLIDGYLLETASDAYLKPKKFYQLAVALPDYAGIFDHGLYRSVDVYHKVWLPSDRCQADLAVDARSARAVQVVWAAGVALEVCH